MHARKGLLMVTMCFALVLPLMSCSESRFSDRCKAAGGTGRRVDNGGFVCYDKNGNILFKD